MIKGRVFLLRFSNTSLINSELEYHVILLKRYWVVFVLNDQANVAFIAWKPIFLRLARICLCSALIIFITNLNYNDNYLSFEKTLATIS